VKSEVSVSGFQVREQIMYCCYLLKSERLPNCKATYIGFSNDPVHRLRQHNGEIVSGARKTSKYRPWRHVAIVSGFPSHHTALQFEWQWQHPSKSRIADMTSSSSSGGYKRLLGILSHLLQTSLWRRLGLTVYLFSEQYHREFSVLLTSPSTVPLVLTTSAAFAEIHAAALSERDRLVQQPVRECGICHNRRYRSEHRYWACPECASHCHLICLAEQQRQQSNAREGNASDRGDAVAATTSHLHGPLQLGSLVPQYAFCAGCGRKVAWADAVRASMQVLDLAFSAPYLCCDALAADAVDSPGTDDDSDGDDAAGSDVEEDMSAVTAEAHKDTVRSQIPTVCTGTVEPRIGYSPG
jgi:structure-specific endonuclease subunit SLX1